MTDDTPEKPEKMALASMDVAAEKRDALRGLFPEVFTEGEIDFERLKRTLGAWAEPGRERFGLTWPGKAGCMRIIQQPSVATLKPAPADSVDFDETENLFIEGDNLEVLKLLQKAYFGKVKMIYIDPPYNTGNEFIYPDDYGETLATYLKYTGQIDDNGRKFSTNTDTDGRYHSRWLNMMYPRLYLARNLLREDGVIFISIDDHEQANLKALCDIVFGEENFVANVVWQKKYAPTNDAKGFSVSHDYVMTYQKSESFDRNLLPRTKETNKPYIHDDKDGKGLWRSGDLLVKTFSKSGVFPIKNPNTGEKFNPPQGSSWRGNKETIDKWLSEGRIYFGKDGTGAPQLKRYLSEIQQGIVPTTWWSFEDAGHNDGANKEVRALFESSVLFDTPKPTKLISKMLKIGSSKQDIILDFFAGSGTTAHAVMALNAGDGGKRTFICVQLPEPCDEKSEAFKAGYETVADIGKERIRRAGRKIAEAADGGDTGKGGKTDTGFRVFRLDRSNFRVWDDRATDAAEIEKQLELHADHVAPDSTPEDILYELLLKSGFPLTTPCERVEMAGKQVFSVENGEMLICLEKEITAELIDALAAADASRIICLDEGFRGDDRLKVNAVQTFRVRAESRETEIVFRTV